MRQQWPAPGANIRAGAEPGHGPATASAGLWLVFLVFPAFPTFPAFLALPTFLALPFFPCNLRRDSA